MELMSSLLLCALVALLPRTLGVKSAFESGIKVKDLKMIGQTVPRKKILLKPNTQLVSIQSELQSVFTDLICTKCINCMERAIKANRIHTHVTKIKPNTEELENDVIVGYYQYKPFKNNRHKRHTGNVNIDEKTNQSTTQSPNILKPNKTVTVTKYNNGGQIYAVKIQEANLGQHDVDAMSSTCEVYSIKKYFPCDSPAGESMLTTAKRKLHKRSKKEHERKTILTTTEKASLQTQSRATKRQVDNSQMPENLMTSIEELY